MCTQKNVVPSKGLGLHYTSVSIEIITIETQKKKDRLYITKSFNTTTDNNTLH